VSPIGVLKQKELSEFIVSVIKGQTELIPKKKGAVSDSESDPDDTRVAHEEL